ncbi:TPA: major capsid protein [Serratia marcescens]|uniref:Phage protein n=1 Tax=Serratia marcescens TaxID=615 RepID=A0A345IPR4_SERMA|nr:phage protein [Serratia marcescens]AXH01836.1 FIG00639045: hypothetical protein [Serratia marcescens]AXH02469.1 FIG00639045: hypothetical protein [Serratia marcescens]EZQ69414.1 hypothetical protein AF53_03081 [Serratia marcescens BIDMC 80]RLO44618.1 hypothetical protein CLM68_11395 [Serratia marcescens]RLO48235.1 hypothetical protein CLM66_18005 [Serratia marcescens]
MAIKSTNALTLTDWAKRVDPNGKVAVIVELLSQTNPILTDMLYVEANEATAHQTTVRTGLPEATWRLLNYGVQPSKSTTAQVKDSIGMLESYAEVDKKLADLNGNTTEFRMSEDRAFIESMNQQMAETLFYGDTSISPQRFTGLSARYNDKSAKSGQNIVDAGGTGSNLTSIWLVVWGSDTVHGIFPKGGTAGLSHDDKGQVTLEDPQKGKYEGYRTHYQWDNGLTVRDWRYAVRIANVDTTKLGADDGPNLATLMVQALHRIPNLQMGKAAFYMNRDAAEYLDIQATEKASLAISVKETEGVWWTSFRGVPVRTCDALLSTESQVQ